MGFKFRTSQSNVQYSEEINAKMPRAEVEEIAQVRFRAQRAHLNRFYGFFPEYQGQNLVLTFLYVIYSLESGTNLRWDKSEDAARRRRRDRAGIQPKSNITLEGDLFCTKH